MLRYLFVLTSVAACSGRKDKPAPRDAAPPPPTVVEAAPESAPEDAGSDAAVELPAGDASAGEPSKVVQIERDGAQACARRLDGQVRCWGSGDPEEPGAVVPVAIAGIPEAASIHLAYGQLAVVTRGGDLALGPLSLPEQPALALVPTGEGIDVRLATARRAYVLTRAGNVIEIDSGRRADKPTAINVIALSSRASDNVDALHRDGTVTTITGGKAHAVKDLKTAQGLFGTRCAHKRDDAIACWTPAGKPTKWIGPQNVVDILADEGSVCTIADRSIGCDGKLLALPGPPIAMAAANGSWCVVLESGEVACWGNNDIGQLGDGTLIDRPEPVAIAGASSAAPPTAPATPALPVAATAMDWTGVPDGCTRTEKMATVADPEPIAVQSAYVRPLSGEWVVWFADFALPATGPLEGRVARGPQRARWFALAKGKPGKATAPIVRGRYQTSTPKQRARSGSDRYTTRGGGDADVLVEKVTDDWMCGTVLVGTARYPFSAKMP